MYKGSCFHDIAVFQEGDGSGMMQCIILLYTYDV